MILMFYKFSRPKKMRSINLLPVLKLIGLIFLKFYYLNPLYLTCCCLYHASYWINKGRLRYPSVEIENMYF